MMLRGGRFYLRRHVPTDIQPIIGRAEVWRFLKTDSLQIALRRLPQMTAALGSDFERIRHDAGLTVDETLLRPSYDDLNVPLKRINSIEGEVAAPSQLSLAEACPPDDPRKVEGFRLLYIAVNIAGLIAPLVIGTVCERAHWQAGFALSCGSMLVELAIYRPAVSAPDGAAALSRPDAALDSDPVRPTATYPGLLLLAAILAMLSVLNAQITNAYLLWAKQSFDRVVWGLEVPASWIIAADGQLSLCALAGTGAVLALA